MKKLFACLSAAVVAASSAFAVTDDVVYVDSRPYHNYVVNGSFEAPGVEMEYHFGWDPWNTFGDITNLPGWSLATASSEANMNSVSQWNGIIMYEEEEGDGDVRPEGDLHYLRFRGYNQLGWARIAAMQVVSGLTPGKTYRFTYNVTARFPQGDTYTPEPDFGYRLSDVNYDEEGQLTYGNTIAERNLAKSGLWDSESWGYTEEMFNVPTVEFTAPADGQVLLYIYIDNQYGQDNVKNMLDMLVDNVVIYDPAENGEVPELPVIGELSDVVQVMPVGSKLRLRPEFDNENATSYTEVYFESGDKSVARVDDAGNVSFVGAGKTHILAFSNKRSFSYVYEVEAVAAESLNVFPAEVRGAKGENVYLLAIYSPENTTERNVVWSSDDESVATVDADGRVTLVGAGTTDIVATDGDLSARCTVSVGDFTNVTAVVASSIEITIVEDGIIIRNLSEMEQVIVYDVDGRIVAAGVAAGELSFKLSAGIYIVRMGEAVAKVRV